MLEDVSQFVWVALAMGSLTLLLPMPWWFIYRSEQSSKGWRRAAVGLTVALILMGGIAIIAYVEPHILGHPFELLVGASCIGPSLLGIALAVWYVLDVFLRQKGPKDLPQQHGAQFTIYQLLGGTFLLGVLFAVTRVFILLPHEAGAFFLFFLAMASMTVIAGGVTHILLRASDPSAARRRRRKEGHSITLPPGVEEGKQEDDMEK